MTTDDAAAFFTLYQPTRQLHIPSGLGNVDALNQLIVDKDAKINELEDDTTLGESNLQKCHVIDLIDKCNALYPVCQFSVISMVDNLLIFRRSHIAFYSGTTAYTTNITRAKYRTNINHVMS